MRAFITQWGDVKNLDNARFAVALFVPIFAALATGMWLVVIGRPLSSYGCYVLSVVIWCSFILVAAGQVLPRLLLP